MGNYYLATNLFKSAAKHIKACSRRNVLKIKPNCNINITGLKFATSPIGDTVELSKLKRANKIKFFTSDEILDMKPDMFSEIMRKRTDIPENLKNNILSPEKLNLYDELSETDIIRKMPQEKRDRAFSKLFSEFNFKISEPPAQLEIIPALVKKGFDIEVLANLPITNANKNQIEYVLSRNDLISTSWEKRAEEIIKRGKARNFREDSIKTELNFNKKYFKINQLINILNYIDNNNVKYLDECITLTNNPSLLKYWTKDFAKIIKDFRMDNFSIDIFDRIFRRSHNYESIKNILGDEKLTDLSARLLEFKNFEKLKDIGLGDLSQLSIDEKKELLNGFISAISPKEAICRKEYSLEDIRLLQSKMKIFREIDTTSNETFINSHKNIINKILDSIPSSERKIINTAIDTKSYRREYRQANPIPTLVDDIESVLKIKETEIKGRKIKISAMDRDVDFGIATHRIPNAEAIKTIEALEITDPDMLICVGTKGGRRDLNFSDGGYAIAVKPRRGSDWHVQANSDIDSGNNASKNIYNFENIILNACGNHCGCIDLVPNQIKKILNLSQREYTQRMKFLKDCTTLQEIEKIDFEMANTIRQIIKEQDLHEGLIRPEPMAVLVRCDITKQELSEEILDYCVRRNIPLIAVNAKAKIPATMSVPKIIIPL